MEVGCRIVYTPAVGEPQLATVRFVGDTGRLEYGLEFDGVSILRSDGRHPISGERHFVCEMGRGLYVRVGSPRVQLAADPGEQARGCHERLLHGL